MSDLAQRFEQAVAESKNLPERPDNMKDLKRFRVLVALPDGTNTPYEKKDAPDPMDALLWARNKWLIAHPESAEAAQGAFVGLSGDNLDIKALL